MRALSILLFLPAIAFAQLSGPVYNPANVKITGGTISVGTLAHSSTEQDGSYLYSAPTTGSTVTVTTANDRVIINPAGSLAALTVTLPACNAANDGLLERFSSSQAITTLTVNASSGSVSNAPASLAAGGGAEFICRGANTTFYRMY